MPTAIPIACEQLDVIHIVEDVFETMLNLPVAATRAALSSATGTLTAAVHLAGSWKGAVWLRCNSEQAFAFTMRLMPEASPKGVDDDVRDALGELANMLGGNLKSLLPRGTSISMPSVVEGGDYAASFRGRHASKTLAFATALGVFWVTLVQLLEGESAN